MGRTAKKMRFPFGGTPSLNRTEPLAILSWLGKFIKACDQNEESERTGLYLLPSFLAGEEESRSTRNMTRVGRWGGSWVPLEAPRCGQLVPIYLCGAPWVGAGAGKLSSGCTSGERKGRRLRYARPRSRRALRKHPLRKKDEAAADPRHAKVCSMDAFV